MSNESQDPRFGDQLAGYSETEVNDTDPIFSRAYHKFMVNLLQTRDKAIKDELIGALSEVLSPWHVEMEQMIAGQKQIQDDVNQIKDMIAADRERIEKLEVAFDVVKGMLEGHGTILGNLQKRVKRLENCQSKKRA